jgi:ankyrin repeat protein
VAALHRDGAMVEALAKRGADITAEDEVHRTPLYYAGLRYDTDMCKYLREHGAKK